jgi:hypothetical protein
MSQYESLAKSDHGKLREQLQKPRSRISARSLSQKNLTNEHDPEPVQSTTLEPIFLISSLILYSRVILGLQSPALHRVSPLEISMHFLPSLCVLHAKWVPCLQGATSGCRYRRLHENIEANCEYVE